MNNTNSSHPKILIVEDDADLNNAYRLILTREGFEAECAADGIEAIAKLEDFTPDLVLLDIRMPNLDGVGFLEQSKISTRFPEAIVIVFTNFDLNKDIESTFKLGVNRYVLKSSITPKDLVKIVREELGIF